MISRIERETCYCVCVNDKWTCLTEERKGERWFFVCSVNSLSVSIEKKHVKRKRDEAENMKSLRGRRNVRWCAPPPLCVCVPSIDVNISLSHSIQKLCLRVQPIAAVQPWQLVTMQPITWRAQESRKISRQSRGQRSWANSGDSSEVSAIDSNLI